MPGIWSTQLVLLSDVVTVGGCVVSRGCAYAKHVPTLIACSNSSCLTCQDPANTVVRNRNYICLVYTQNKGRIRTRFVLIHVSELREKFLIRTNSHHAQNVLGIYDVVSLYYIRNSNKTHPG
jgi:hypothetical protein